MHSKVFAKYFYEDGKIKTDVEIILDGSKIIGKKYNVKPSADAIILKEDDLLTYGFVNAHTHLELTHLKSKIPSGAGMLNFLLGVVKNRNKYPFDENLLQEELQKAKANGTVFFGDIANSTEALVGKTPENNITFIEAIGLENEEKRLREYIDVLKTHRSYGIESFMVPHAPYTITAKMWEFLRNFWDKNPPEVISIHLLETEEERQIIEKGTGDFATFVKRALFPPKKDVVELLINNLPYYEGTKYLFVHLTIAKEEELQRLISNYKDAYFVLCPRSNYYITRRIPDMNLFRKFKDKILLGTDSLASNYDLNVFNELRFLARNYDISIEEGLDYLVGNPRKIFGNVGENLYVIKDFEDIGSAKVEELVIY